LNYRGHLKTGPMVVMMYLMILTDLLKFGVIFFIFIAGFSGGIIFEVCF